MINNQDVIIRNGTVLCPTCNNALVITDDYGEDDSVLHIVKGSFTDVYVLRCDNCTACNNIKVLYNKHNNASDACHITLFNLVWGIVHG